jgi:hypothetical protein
LCHSHLKEKSSKIGNTCACATYDLS